VRAWVGFHYALDALFRWPEAEVGFWFSPNTSARTSGARDDLTVSRCEACIYDARDYGPIEPMDDHERVLCDAVLNTGQQRECTALFLAEDWFSGMRCHAPRHI
jgi:hypothetical protein